MSLTPLDISLGITGWYDGYSYDSTNNVWRNKSSSSNLYVLEAGAGGLEGTGPVNTDGSANASSWNSPNYPPIEAFNGTISSNSDGWLTAIGSGGVGGALPFPHWLSFEFPSEKYITKYKIWARNHNDYILAPQAWTLRGATSSSEYNSGTYTVIDTRSNQTNWVQTTGGTSDITNDIKRNEYYVANPGYYKYYVLHITANNNSNNSYVSIGELAYYSEAIHITGTLTPSIYHKPAQLVSYRNNKKYMQKMFKYIVGSTTSRINFPTGFLADTSYTLFHVARRDPNGIDLNGRIFDGSGSNWYSGFSDASSGVTAHDLSYVNTSDRKYGNNWVVSVDRPNYYRSIGYSDFSSGYYDISSGSRTDNASPSSVPQLTINNGSTTNPITVSNLISTGGIKTSYSYNNETYIVHTFLSNGSFNVTRNISVDFLIVGGGGGAGSRYGSGAGGGGVVIATQQSISSGTHSVVVGQGGAGGIITDYNNYTDGTNGGDSSFYNFIGKGGGSTNKNGGAGNSGGSAGGKRWAGDSGSGNSNQDQYSSTANVQGYGNSGGDGASLSGSGGGGAGAIGGNASAAPGPCGSGGDGIQNNFRTSTNIYYGGGGGGGRHGAGGGGTTAQGGQGGGGNGGQLGGNYDGSDGAANSGGGGGGPSITDTGSQNDHLWPDGGSGGSGIVVIRYKINASDLSGCDWNVAEVFAYNKHLSGSEEDSLADYLKFKYLGTNQVSTGDPHIYQLTHDISAVDASNTQQMMKGLPPDISAQTNLIGWYIPESYNIATNPGFWTDATGHGYDLSNCGTSPEFVDKDSTYNWISYIKGSKGEDYDTATGFIFPENILPTDGSYTIIHVARRVKDASGNATGRIFDSASNKNFYSGFVGSKSGVALHSVDVSASR